MKKIISRSLTLAALACLSTQILLPTPARAQSYLETLGLAPDTQYKTFETAHFKFTYADGYLEFTQKAAEYFEKANSVLAPILKWQPRTKTSILVVDNADSANGLTSPALRIGIVLIATPPDVNLSTVYNDDWIKLLVFHEYTHLLNIDATTKWIEVLRYLFGDVIRPNGLWPKWMLEGLAVYYETRTSKLGRGRSPYYDSILRAEFLDGRLGNSEKFGITLDKVNGDFPMFPSGEIPYLFGYHLWNQFAIDRNKDSDMGEYSLRSSHRVPFFIEGNLKNITGKHWKDYWNAFIEESNVRFEKQFAEVRSAGVTPTESVTHSNYSAVGGAASPDGKWIAYNETRLDQRQHLYLKNLESNQLIQVVQTAGGLAMSFTPDSRYLLFSAMTKTDSYHLYSDLYYYDLKTGHRAELSHGARFKDPNVSPDGNSVTFIQVDHATHHLGEATLVRKGDELSLTNVHTVYHPKAFSILGTPRYRNNDEIVFSLQERERTDSDLMSFTRANNAVKVLFHDGAMNRYPLPLGGKLFYISDRSGIENLYQLDQKSNLASNVLTGLSMPFGSSALLDAKDQLFASLMTSNGYDIVRFTPETRTRQKHFALPSAPNPLEAALYETPKITPDPVNYTPWGSLLPRAWAPFAYATNGTNSGTTIGGAALGFDTTGKQEYIAFADYNFKPKTLDGSLTYSLYYFRPVITLNANAITSDIGINQQYKRGYEVSATLEYPIFFTYSSLRPRVYGFMDWNGIYDINSKARLATSDFQYSNTRIPGFGASLSFSDAQSSALGFMSETGNDVSIAAEDRISERQFSEIKYLASYAHYFQIGEHSVLQPKAKVLGSTHTTPYNQSYALLEGKRSYEITDRGTSLNLSRMGIRGYFFDQTARTRVTGIGSLDYSFPVYQWFKGWGTVPVFLKQFYANVFAECGYIPSNRHADTFLPAYGASVSLTTSLLLYAPVRFNLEVQNGTKKDLGGDTSVFFSISSSNLF